MDYTVVYDAANVAPDWWFPATGLAPIVSSLVVWRFRHRMPLLWHGPFATSARWRTRFCLVCLGFSIFWTSFAAFSVFVPYVQAQRALRAGSARIVQGRVENFCPMPSNGHGTERFTVQGVHFAYSDAVVSPFFKNTRSHGGPIRPGLLVRIYYLGTNECASIVKLEIKR